MSIRAMNWAWGLQLEPCPKLVILALADIADDKGEAWPSVRHLARKTCVSARTIQRVLRTFARDRLIQIAERRVPSGRQTASVYRLALTANGEGDKLSPSLLIDGSADTGRTTQPCHPPGDRHARGRVTQLRHREGDTAMSPLEPPLEPPCESSLQPSPEPSRLNRPRSLDLSERQRLENLLTGFSATQRQEMLDSLAAAMLAGRLRSTPERYLDGAMRRQRDQQRVRQIVTDTASRLRVE